MSFDKRRRALDAVEYMLSAIDEIGGFVAGLDKRRFLADRKTALAVTHLVMTLGEAARDLLDGIAVRQPGIPWKQVRDMRHRIAHEYRAVDPELVWDVATTDLAPLRDALTAERDWLTSC